MSLNELLEELRNVEEVQLMELLEINSDDLVDAFFEKVEEEQERLIKYFNDEN